MSEALSFVAELFMHPPTIITVGGEHYVGWLSVRPSAGASGGRQGGLPPKQNLAPARGLAVIINVLQ